MSNVVSINSKRFAGLSTLAPNEKSDLEGRFLFAGSLLSLILFQTVCVTLGETIHSVLFAGGFSIGVVTGLIKYFYFPFKMPALIEWENTPEINQDIRISKAG